MRAARQAPGRLAADHLGSITALTSSTGGLVDRFSYDPWGKRRQAVTSPWLAILPGSHLIPASLANLTRGFTSHEHLDRVGLVHMNGRIYDPELGRFLSADPILQFPASTQGLDRYAYVLNNPVSLSDPSGHLVWTIAGAALGAWLRVKVNVALGILTAALGGYLDTGSLKAAVFSVISATFSFGVGQIGAALANAGWSSAFQLAAVATLHGLTQGILAVAQGGKFGAGFLSAAASSWFGPKNDGTVRLDGKQRLIRVVKAAAVGGTASRIGGGKFANGAVMSQPGIPGPVSDHVISWKGDWPWRNESTPRKRSSTSCARRTSCSGRGRASSRPASSWG